ncbi:hypothetical protein ATE68_20800 [Sphingopyxis sp. H038]|nr:hypothetical protein ATE78_14085 [Sphingopyxis sp. H012]KTE07559.1 hypothetical protein ATE76_17355 [Sphingopyxis sp. H093]KTE12731.1 hypothetical protein ATE70_05705 [Sphingopyxis sp. H053]KTE24895.1 hypothetical protein ATE75_17450 [Sphingopyxis sp. H080]KTE31987.1 hypothetical protein ATE68_20800 [Sphingopyxis sp. H038]KTE39121.1 hypothetical protein ATE73_19180 [Sphingopyxis sp. H077]KTE40302.1 hypothetical protein ATE77_20040 [Sphingopyxis sp. H005]KTE65048.1 hypothetical protein ATE
METGPAIFRALQGGEDRDKVTPLLVGMSIIFVIPDLIRDPKANAGGDGPRIKSGVTRNDWSPPFPRSRVGQGDDQQL